MLAAYQQLLDQAGGYGAIVTKVAALDYLLSGGGLPSGLSGEKSMAVIALIMPLGCVLAASIEPAALDNQPLLQGEQIVVIDAAD